MDTAKAYVWRLQNFVLGEHILNPCPENPTPVKVRNSTLSIFSVSWKSLLSKKIYANYYAYFLVSVLLL